MNKKQHQREVREQKQAEAERAAARKAGMMKIMYMGIGALVMAAILTVLGLIDLRLGFHWILAKTRRLHWVTLV